MDIDGERAVAKEEREAICEALREDWSKFRTDQAVRGESPTESLLWWLYGRLAMQQVEINELWHAERGHGPTTGSNWAQ